MANTMLAHNRPDEPSPPRFDVKSRPRRSVSVRQPSERGTATIPTPCERDYTHAELEFFHAMQAYKVQSGRMFPTWSEVLEVLKSLGYQRVLNDPAATA